MIVSCRTLSEIEQTADLRASSAPGCATRDRCQGCGTRIIEFAIACGVGVHTLSIRHRDRVQVVIIPHDAQSSR